MTVNEEVIIKYELYGYGKKPSWSVCPRTCLEVMQNTKKIFGVSNLQAEFPILWVYWIQAELKTLVQNYPMYELTTAATCTNTHRLMLPDVLFMFNSQELLCVCVCVCLCVINSMCHGVLISP